MGPRSKRKREENERGMERPREAPKLPQRIVCQPVRLQIYTANVPLSNSSLLFSLRSSCRSMDRGLRQGGRREGLELGDESRRRVGFYFLPLVLLLASRR